MSQPAYEAIPLERFQEVFKDTSTGESDTFPECGAIILAQCSSPVLWIDTEVSSVALGAKIVSFSDEFFAEASNLLKVEVSFRYSLFCLAVLSEDKIANEYGMLHSTAFCLHERPIWPQRSAL
jgi:hypothetical protein